VKGEKRRRGGLKNTFFKSKTSRKTDTGGRDLKRTACFGKVKSKGVKSKNAGETLCED